MGKVRVFMCIYMSSVKAASVHEAVEFSMKNHVCNV